MPLTPRSLKVGAVVGALALSSAIGWRVLAADQACDMGLRAPQIVSELKASSDLPFWKHESCKDDSRDIRLPNNHTLQHTIHECTWDDGQVVLRTSHSEPAAMMSVHLTQKASSTEADQTFHSVARLLIGQVRKLDGDMKDLLEDAAIADAFTGKLPYS